MSFDILMKAMSPAVLKVKEFEEKTIVLSKFWRFGFSKFSCKERNTINYQSASFFNKKNCQLSIPTTMGKIHNVFLNKMEFQKIML